jgi:hypothetical protein
LGWLTTIVLAVALLVVSLLVAAAGYVYIVKRHFPDLVGSFNG